MELCRTKGGGDGTHRHEIMHALRTHHEHQHPDSDCQNQFDLNSFRPSFFDADPQANEAAIRVNIEVLTKSYRRDELLVISYDPRSIMHYKLDPVHFKAGTSRSCALTSPNDDLSAADREFLRAIYPK